MTEFSAFIGLSVQKGTLAVAVTLPGREDPTAALRCGLRGERVAAKARRVRTLAYMRQSCGSDEALGTTE